MQHRKEHLNSKHHQAPLEEFEASICNSSASSITCSAFWSSTQSSAFSFDRTSTLSLLSSFSNSVSSTSLAAGGEDDTVLNSKRWLVSSLNASGDTSKSDFVRSPPQFQRVGASLRLLEASSAAALAPPVCAASTAASSSTDSGDKNDSTPPAVPKAAWQLREERKKKGKTTQDFSPQMPRRSWPDEDAAAAAESYEKRGIRSFLSNVCSTNPSAATSSVPQTWSNHKKEATRKELAPKPAHSLPAAFQSACFTRSISPLIGVSRWDNSTNRGDESTSTRVQSLGGRAAATRSVDAMNSSMQGMTMDASRTIVVPPTLAPHQTRSSSSRSSSGGNRSATPGRPQLRRKSRPSLDTIPAPPSHSFSLSPKDKKKEKIKKNSHFYQKPLRRHKSDHRHRSKSILHDSLSRILEEGESDDVTSPGVDGGQSKRIFVRKSCPNMQVPTLFTQWEHEFGREKNTTTTTTKVEQQQLRRSEPQRPDPSAWSGVGRRCLEIN